jgi:diguanylate cyclase (GGDEF)-like protein
LIRGKKPTILALRLCASIVTGLMLWSLPPQGWLNELAALAWLGYVAGTVVFAILDSRWYSHPRFNSIYVGVEFLLLGLFLGVYHGAAWSFYPFFLLTVLLAALSRRLVLSLLLGLGVACAHVFLNVGSAGLVALTVFGSEASILILQASILLTTAGVIGYLTEELERQESTAELLDSALQISSLLTGALDLDTLYERVTHVLARLFRAGRVAVIQAEPGWNEARVLSAIDRGQVMGELTIDMARYPEIRTAIERRQTIVVGDTTHYPGLQPIRSKRLQNATILVAPIEVDDHPRGVVFVRLEDHRGGFTMRQVNFCRLLANATAQGIAQAERVAEMERAAFVDPLTGLQNLRSFHAQLQREMERAERTEQPLALLMIDVDCMKRVNDTHGHLAGDEVLVQLATLLGEEVRDLDIVARYGGEEFAVLLVDTDSWCAYAVAERIRTRIEECAMPHVGSVTASVGIAAYPQDGITPRDLVHRADQALYFSKYRGRNRVTQYDALHQELGEREVDHALLEAFTSVSLERHLNHDDPRIKALRDRLVSFRSSREVVEHFGDVIHSLTAAMEAKDTYTREHLESAAALADLFLDRLELEDEERRAISIACLLHDIGKLGIREEILQKTEFLTREEYEIVRRHPVIGAHIIEPLRAFRIVVPYIRHHHERWDGKGYPDGLKGVDIPYGARVVAIIDAFHAMISWRPYYARVRGLGYACEEIRRNAGTQFDPALVEVFLDVVEDHRDTIARFVAAGADGDDLADGERSTRLAPPDPASPRPTEPIRARA